jgi:hypothetical protein
MNSRFKAIIFILAMVFVLFATACTVSGGKSLNSAEALKEYLDKQPANSPDKPIRVTMTANALMLEKIASAIASSGKYVSLNLSGNVLTTIPDLAFFDKSTDKGSATLTSITIPNGVASIGESAFASCNSLISVTIPNSVTTIGKWAFFNCTVLVKVTIPTNVTSVHTPLLSIAL